VREEPVSRQVVEVPVSRKALFTALQKGAPLNDIRLIQIFSGSSSGDPDDEAANQAPPEYRFFDIKPESAYSILGLRNGDVLLSAHDYIVYDPNKFASYVAKLVEMPDGFVDLRRDGLAVRLKYNLQ
jgi:hypothetical protein